MSGVGFLDIWHGDWEGTIPPELQFGPGADSTGASKSHVRGLLGQYEPAFAPLLMDMTPEISVIRKEPSRPTSHKEWDSAKEIIRRLYLVENLPLKEITTIMSKDHSFFATNRMYKRQFQRWNWRKYNTRGLQKCEMDGQVVERPHGQMTCRRPHKGHRNPQISKSPRNKEACVHNYARSPISTNSILPEGLRYISGNDRSTQILLKILHDLIQGASCDEGSVWNGENIKFTGLLTAGAGVLSQLNLAIRLFTSQDFQQGGAILRKAFRSLESVVDREAIEIHQVLLLHIPYYLPSAYRDILHTYLGHLGHILEAKQKQHPIAKIARAMEAISSESSDLLMDVMERMFSATAHNYNQLRGLDDLASIQATLESFLSTKRTPTKSESSHLLKRFEDLLESSTAMFGETSERVIEIESRQISAAARMEALSIAEGFIELCERHLARICAANRFSRLERWDRWSLSRYSETKDRMFDAFAHEGDIDRGMSCLKESMKALSLANEIAESEEDVASYASTLWHHRIFLVDVLDALGRAAEAEEVRKSVAAPRYVQEVLSKDLDESFH